MTEFIEVFLIAGSVLPATSLPWLQIWVRAWKTLVQKATLLILIGWGLVIDLAVIGHFLDIEYPAAVKVTVYAALFVGYWTLAVALVRLRRAERDRK